MPNSRYTSLNMLLCLLNKTNAKCKQNVCNKKSQTIDKIKHMFNWRFSRFFFRLNTKLGMFIQQKLYAVRKKTSQIRHMIHCLCVLCQQNAERQ